MQMTTQDIDKALLSLHAKLKATDNRVVQHQLIHEINRLLDERNRLKK